MEEGLVAMWIQQEHSQRGAGNRHMIVSVLIMSVISLILIALFYIMYSGARQNILNSWENNVIQLSKSADYYLARPVDAIEFSSTHVEELIAEGKTNREIGDYLVKEMGHYASLVENNYTGVYGYCRGEYLDASGWIPDADYEPTQRPWYLAAKENKGRVALVSPFLNLQTQEMMMSVSKLLADGESVLSIDIFMEGLQKTLDDLTLDQGVKAAFLMDSSGCVVVHSRQDEVGRNYLENGSDYEKGLVLRARALAEREDYYEVGPAKGEILFTAKVGGSWYAVLILDESSLLSPIRYLYMLLILILLLSILAWYGISGSINRKYREAEQLSQEIKAVADIYEAMTLVDLDTDCMTILRSSEELDRLLEGDFTGYSKRSAHLAGNLASEEHRDLLIQFMNPETYEERLRDVHSLSYDFLSKGGRWLRLQLIVVDRDAQGKLKHLIWAIESIDKERRQQEKFRKLAETDELSRLSNRRSGEARLRALLDAGTAGTFLMMDINAFKSINDGFGHVAGDLVITAVADCLRRTIRESDIAYRLGGDEFAAFLPGLEHKEAVARLVQRLHREISGIHIPELHGYGVTVSIGVSSFTGKDQDTFEALYQRADEKMYEEKRQKKNLRRH